MISRKSVWRKVMRIMALQFMTSKLRRRGFAVAMAAVSLAGQSAMIRAQAADPAAAECIQRPRSVQAIAVPTQGPNGLSSWIIEPDAPRIPKIAGLESQLPPHIQRRLEYAFDLAQRGATYSASAEFQAVLGLCAHELDARSGTTCYRDALCQGWTALNEADDFEESRTGLLDPTEIRHIASIHSTRLLADPESKIDSMQAVQAYYAFAEERLASACKEMPAASLAYYGLGRTFVIPGCRVTHGAAKAALLQRVALIIAPQNVLAGNELGVLLAQHGHLDASEKLFRECLAISPRPETWRNLATVHARNGNQAASQSAMAAGDALAAENRMAAAVTPIADLQPQDRSNGPKEKPRSGILSKLNIPSFSGTFRR
jgi:hypothetical protein